MIVLIGDYKSEWGNGSFEWDTVVIALCKTEEGLRKAKVEAKIEGYVNLKSYPMKIYED